MHDLAQHRPQLFAIAYRMLGSGSDAEDVLQDAWFRYERADAVDNPAAWLTTCVTRLCIDELRSARKRREVYVGPWLPEPEVTVDEEVDSESVSLALLRILERLSPKERAVYVLAEVFDYKHGEIAEIVEISVAASRKSLSRAKARIQEDEPRYAPSQEAHASMLAKFIMAVQMGDVAPLEALLAADAKAITDAGGLRSAARRAVLTRDHVAKLFLGLAKKSSGDYVLTPVRANGWPALLMTQDGEHQLIGIETDGEQIQSVFVIRNPEKMPRLVRALGL